MCYKLPYMNVSNNICYFSLGLILLKKKKDNLKHSKQELKKKKQNYLVQIQFNAPKLFIYILE